MRWTDADDALLQKLHAEGYSFGQIAARIGGISRNAAIGRAGRLGLLKRRGDLPRKPIFRKPSGGKRPGHKRAPFHLSAEKLAIARLRASAYRAEPDLVIPEAERRTLLELEPGDCRWPYGSGAPGDPFYFCNRAKVAGGPYCEFHMARAVDPVGVGRRKKILGRETDAPVSAGGRPSAPVTEAA